MGSWRRAQKRLALKNKKFCDGQIDDHQLKILWVVLSIEIVSGNPTLPCSLLYVVVHIAADPSFTYLYNSLGIRLLIS